MSVAGTMLSLVFFAGVVDRLVGVLEVTLTHALIADKRPRQEN